MADNDFTFAELDLYIKYSILPARQYSTIIGAVDGLTFELWKLHFGVRNSRLSYFPYFYYEESEYFPFCIRESHTGESIRTRFGFHNRMWPSMKIVDKDTIEILLPKWSAIVLLSGMILNYGLDKYKEVLEISKLSLENEKLQKELHEQAEDVEEIKKRRDVPFIYSIEQNINIFQSQVNKPNIEQVMINGVEVQKASYSEPSSNE